jgi:hypothetical protein
MIGDMAHDATRTAVLGTERTDEPFPFATYVALASARDHMGPVAVQARHLPYGVWWDRLRPTIELIRPSGDDQPVATDLLPLDGLWDDHGRFLGPDDDGYDSAAATYRTGNGLF